MARVALRPSCATRPVHGNVLVRCISGTGMFSNQGPLARSFPPKQLLAGMQCDLGTAATGTGKEAPRISTELGMYQRHSRWRPGE
jgi:hypothetical protein